MQSSKIILLVFTPRLEIQVNSLKAEIDNKQQIIAKMETVVAETESKFEAAPKFETIERLNLDIERLTKELEQAKETVTE